MDLPAARKLLFTWDGNLYALEKYVTVKPEDVGLESCKLGENKKWCKLIDVNYVDNLQEINGKELSPIRQPILGRKINDLWVNSEFWLEPDEVENN